MPLTASSAKRTLLALRDSKKVAIFSRFFKTGPGQYGEGDQFLGIPVPQVRAVVRQYRDLPLPEVSILLASPLHEVRLLAVLILVDQSRRGTPALRQQILKFYLKHLSAINNWDLVDASAPDLLGIPLLESGKFEVLKKLANSKKLWHERIAVVGTFAFIRQGEFAHILSLSEQFLSHQHDLMHKATGWMLREAGKRDVMVLRQFLDEHGTKMPRTMLRYAIEKFPERERLAYLKRK